MIKKQTKTMSYQVPACSALEALCSSMLCESETGSTINDLVEDDETLGGLFD